MWFNSFNFLAFFGVIYAFYLILSRRYQNYWLLAASYFFYAYWDWRFVALLMTSTFIAYFFGLQMHTATDPGRRRLLLLVSLCAQLGILLTFKYFNFFAESLRPLLVFAGISQEWTFLQVVLPVGLSFYTLQTISCMVDIYRGRTEPTRNIANFALFLSFFPKLLAGPIERASPLLRQVESSRTITYSGVREGLWLILLGYFQKLVIADNMVLYTEPIFAQPENAVGIKVLVALYAFAFQIYGDFAGYSNIARGMSKLLGFDLTLNFHHPYFATNPSDFWRRWHISFSTWLRDYVYIPLGGNRHGTLSTYRNVMLTMLLGALWHKAAWNFVAWGAFHGVLVIGHRMLQSPLKSLAPQGRVAARLWKVGALAVFFHLTCLGWLLFAVRKLSDAPILLSGMFDPFVVNEVYGLITVLLLATPLLLIERWEETAGRIQIVREWSRPARLAVGAGLFAMIVLGGATRTHEFIYFHF